MMTLLGARIESLRPRVGMTRNDVGHTTGMHQMQVTLAEEGKLPNISIPQTAKIADALGVTLASLLADLACVEGDKKYNDVSDILFRRKIGYICYPPVVDWYPVTSLMQYMLYLPLFNSDDLIDMLLRIDGCFAGHEQYVLDLIRRCISFICDSPAKRYADCCLARLDRDHFLSGDLGDDETDHEAYHKIILQFADRMGVDP